LSPRSYAFDAKTSGSHHNEVNDRFEELNRDLWGQAKPPWLQPSDGFPKSGGDLEHRPRSKVRFNWDANWRRVLRFICWREMVPFSAYLSRGEERSETGWFLTRDLGSFQRPNNAPNDRSFRRPFEPVHQLGFGGLCAGDFCWPFAASNHGRFPAPKPKRLLPVNKGYSAFDLRFS
jgi:hypothetical protein